MIHLHRMDFEICLERHRQRQDGRGSERDLDEVGRDHNLIADEEELERWFYESADPGKPRLRCPDRAGTDPGRVEGRVLSSPTTRCGGIRAGAAHAPHRKALRALGRMALYPEATSGPSSGSAWR